MSLNYYIHLAFSVIASTYGWGEMRCGDVGRPRRCVSGAPTASGVPLDTTTPQMAIAVPAAIRVPPRIVYVTAGGDCVAVWLVDKMNPRWIGERGFDLNPAALRALVGEQAATPDWMGRVAECFPPTPQAKEKR